MEVELAERGVSHYVMILTIKGYVYDHRYESQMQTDTPCEAGVPYARLVKPWEWPKELGR